MTCGQRQACEDDCRSTVRLLWWAPPPPAASLLFKPQRSVQLGVATLQTITACSAQAHKAGKMSNLEPPSSPSGASPTRGSKRHQIKRSLSEFTSPTRTRTNTSQRKEQQQHQAEEKRPLPSHVTSPMRHSLDMPRTDFPSAIFSPDPSRRGSVLVARDNHDKSTSRDRADERVPIPRQMASDSAEYDSPSIRNYNALTSVSFKDIDAVARATKCVLHQSIATTRRSLLHSFGESQQFTKYSHGSQRAG